MAVATTERLGQHRRRAARRAALTPALAAGVAALLTAAFSAVMHWLGPAVTDQEAILTALFGVFMVVVAVLFGQRAMRQVKRDLDDADQAWQSLVGNVEGCVWRIDPAGRYTYISPAVTALAGWRPEELIGGSFEGVMPPDSAAAARRLLCARVEGGGVGLSGCYDMVHRRADGTQFLAEVRCSPVLGPEGELVAIQGVTRDVTEQRRAEQALAESEARFAAIVEATPMGVHLYQLMPDDRLVLRAANNAADRLLGIAHAPLVGLTLEAAFPPLAGTEVPVHYRACARAGKPWRTEQIVYDDGSISGAFQVHAFQTQPGFAAVMFLDITEQLRGAQALADSEARFRWLFDEMAQGVVYQNRGGEVELANASACRILGLSMDQMLGRTSLDPRWRTIAEDGSDLPGSEHPAMVALRTGEEVRDRVIGVYNPTEDSYRWIVVSAVPQFRPDEAEPYQVFATFTDVTELRLASQALRANEELLREAQEAARLGSYMTDLRTGEWTTSDTLETLVGVEPGYAQAGNKWRNLIHPDDREAALAQRDQAVATGERFDCVYRVVRPCDGQTRWLHQLGEVEFGTDGKPWRLRGIVIDVTEAKLAEQNQERLEAQLQRSQRLESLGVLAGGIAHDFNNILAAVLGYTELTQDLVPPTSEVGENLREILRGIHRARDLVKQILAFSRRATLSPTPTRLDALIDEVQRMLRAALPASLELRTYLDPDVPAALADSAQIHQVLLNLATNAAQAMPHGGVISIALGSAQVTADDAAMLGDLAPGRYVVITVSDTGCGMDAATRDRIFEPFYTTKAPGEGTGLGLSTSHGIVTSHGGTITVYSELGQGSTFRVWLPAVEAEEPVVEATPAASEVAAPAAAPSRSLRILFVDDEEQLATMAALLLRHQGHDPVVTHDPREALALLADADQPFDLLLTDQTMPHLLGTDLARQARELRPNLPIVLASGFAARMAPDEVAATGISEVLPKPYGGAELAAALARAMGG
mgnify:CR=1 FL=1